MKIKKNEKGFALALSLLVMTIAIALLVGNYLSLTRTQRLASRNDSSISLRWMAQSVVEKTVSEINKKGRLIETEEFSAIVDPIKSPWFRVAFPNVNYVLTSLTIEKKPGGSWDSVTRDYRINVSVQYVPNKTSFTLYEDIRLGTESLFNYAVFYDDDLELAPGQRTDIQGPLFSNGDIYLMSAPGDANALTLKAPDTGAPSNFVMQSAGNIYGFYKPVIARNYLIGVNDFFNDRSNLPARLWNTDINQYAELRNDSEVVPLLYFLKNDIFPSGTDKFSSQGTSPSKIFVKKSDNSLISQLTFPTISYHDVSWEYYKGVFAREFHENNSHYVSEGNYASDSACASGGGVCMNVTPAYKNYSTILGQAERADFGHDSSIDFMKYDPALQSDAADVTDRWTVAQRDGVLKGWVADQAMNVSRKSLSLGSGDPTNNHSIIESLESCADTDVDCQTRNNARFAAKADLKLLCANSDCTNMTLVKKASPSDVPVTIGGSWKIVSLRDDRLRKTYSAAQVDVSKLLTYFDAAEFKSTDPSGGGVLYIETLPFKMTKISGNYTPLNPGTSDSVRLVEIVNGQKLPTKGFTIATNGRLWLHNDYNTTVRADNSTCKGGMVSYPACVANLPSAAIFSDSIGVLSNQYNTLSWASKSDFNSHAQSTSSITINTAVITGYLASTLERWYPKCEGERRGKFSLRGCRGVQQGSYYPNTFIDSETSSDDSLLMPWLSTEEYVQYQGRTDYYGNYMGGKGNLPDGGCPDGVDKLEGTPNQPNNCDIIREPEGDIFYVRRSYLMKRFLDDIFMDKPGNPSLDPNSFVPEVKGLKPLRQYYYSNYNSYLDGTVRRSTGFSITSARALQSKDDNGDVYDLTTDEIDNIKARVNAGLANGIEFDANAWNAVRTILPYESNLPVIQNIRIDTYDALGNKTSEIRPRQMLLFTCGTSSNEVTTSPNVKTRPTPKNPCRVGDPYFMWVSYDTYTNPAQTSSAVRNGLFGTATCAAATVGPCGTTDIQAITGANITVDGVSKLYRVYWRKASINFKNIPDWKIPLFSTGYSVDGEGNYCGSPAAPTSQRTPSQQSQDFNANQCRPEPSAPWPGVPLAANIYTSNRFPVGMIDEVNSAGRQCDSSMEVGSCSGSAPDNNGKKQIYPVPAPLGTMQLDTGAPEDMPNTFPSVVNYQYVDRHAPLYKIHYSGGLENLINMQERWGATLKFYFSGTLTSPWFSKELWRTSSYIPSNYRSPPYSSYEPAYHDMRDGLGFGNYTAPERIFDYNEKLATSPPPGTPNVAAVTRNRLKIVRPERA